jgi:hypothetical protein
MFVFVQDAAETVASADGRDDGLGLGAQKRGPGLAASLGCRFDAGVFEDLPDGGDCDPDAEDEQFAVDAPVSPGAVLPGEAQDQQPDRSNRARPADTLRP